MGAVRMREEPVLVHFCLVNHTEAHCISLGKSLREILLLNYSTVISVTPFPCGGVDCSASSLQLVS